MCPRSSVLIRGLRVLAYRTASGRARGSPSNAGCGACLRAIHARCDRRSGSRSDGATAARDDSGSPTRIPRARRRSTPRIASKRSTATEIHCPAWPPFRVRAAFPGPPARRSGLRHCSPMRRAAPMRRYSTACSRVVGDGDERTRLQLQEHAAAGRHPVPSSFEAITSL